MIGKPEFWVAISFVIFMALLWKKIVAAFTGMLDARTEKIRQELDEAQRLREEALALLSSYQRRQRDAQKEAEEIVAHAKEEAERLARQAAADLEASLKRREAQAVDRIAQMEASAMQEVRTLTVDLAIAASRKLLSENLPQSQQDALVAQAVSELPKHLN
jgi:F-type H+-transporting ATPase subunit b